MVDTIVQRAVGALQQEISKEVECQGPLILRNKNRSNDINQPRREVKRNYDKEKKGNRRNRKERRH